MGRLVMVILFWALEILVKGLVLEQLWNWFLPSILSAPTISYMGAVALAYLVECLNGNRVSLDDKSIEDLDNTKIFSKLISASVLMPLLHLIVGSVIKLLGGF